MAPGSAPWSTWGTPEVLEETCELQKEPKSFPEDQKSASRDPKDVQKWTSGIFFRDDVFFAHKDFERVDKKVR